MDTNHSGLNKYAGRGDVLYKLFKRELSALRTPSILEQADTLVRDSYRELGKLGIERLSGKLLPMEQCYINLTIVKHPHQGGVGKHEEDNSEISPWSLFARQKVETPDSRSEVKLAELFCQREGHDPDILHPRRILIRGRAGVGKTTLCKKMVHDFTSVQETELHRAWTKLFDRILWIPLRNLKRLSTKEHNLEHLFFQEFFSTKGRDYGYSLSKELWREIIDTRSARTLFILDGLDEVSHKFSSDYSTPNLFVQLLNQPNVIITSRPNASLPAGFPAIDLELETIGFYPDQVKAYIQADTAVNPRINDLQSFLDSHWLIQGLVRIPIQLDALCYIWEDLDPESVPNTMTGMYKAIVQMLWKKDVTRLEKQIGGNVKSALPAEIERSVKSEMMILERLAFNGLCSGILDFTSVHRNEIAKTSEPLGNLFLNDTLAQLSFLRTSGPSPNERDRNYHFLHLTLQEYFAAQYFVRQWLEHKELEYAMFGYGNDDTASNAANPQGEPSEFLRRNKYLTNLDVFWRFVSGLLQDEGEAQIFTFFQVVEGVPLDILGPSHQRLIMHCLNEVNALIDSPIRSDIELRLSQWMLFQCDLMGSPVLAEEPECSDNILINALETGSDSEKVKILESLSTSSRQLSETILMVLVTQLERKEQEVRHSASRLLKVRPNLSEAIIAKVIETQQSDVYEIRYDASQVLVIQSNLSEASVKKLVALLQSYNHGARKSAAYVLMRQSNLSEAVIVVLLGFLQHHDIDIRCHAIEILACQSNLSDERLSPSRELLKNQNATIQSRAAVALGRRPTLSEPLANSILTVLQNGDRDLRRNICWGLSSCDRLSDIILTGLITLIQHEDFEPYAILPALGLQSSLSESVVVKLLTLLEHDDEHIRHSAVHALPGKSSSSAVTRALEGILEYGNSNDRVFVANAFMFESKLPDVIAAKLVVLLHDDQTSVQEAAAETLRWTQSRTPIVALVALIQDEDCSILEYASRALIYRYEALPKEGIAALEKLLQHQDHHIRYNAVEALHHQTLSESTTTALAGLIRDDDANVRERSAKVLAHQKNLPEGALMELELLLRSKDAEVRLWAATSLGWNRSDIPESMIERLLSLAQDRGELPITRAAAVASLSSQTNLPEGAAMELVPLLQEEDQEIRNGVITLLFRVQKKLSGASVAAIAALLQSEDTDVRSRVTKAIACGRGRSLNLVFAILWANLNPEGQTHADTKGGTSYIPHLIYGSLLCRNLWWQTDLRTDSRNVCYATDQTRGVWTKHFQDSWPCSEDEISQWRQLWNPRGYKLWHDVGERSLERTS